MIAPLAIRLDASAAESAARSECASIRPLIVSTFGMCVSSLNIRPVAADVSAIGMFQSEKNQAGNGGQSCSDEMDTDMAWAGTLIPMS